MPLSYRTVADATAAEAGVTSHHISMIS